MSVHVHNTKTEHINAKHHQTMQQSERKIPESTVDQSINRNHNYGDIAMTQESRYKRNKDKKINMLKMKIAEFSHGYPDPAMHFLTNWPEALDTVEASFFLGCSAKKLERMRNPKFDKNNRAVLPKGPKFFKMPGGAIRYRPVLLATYIRTNETREN